MILLAANANRWASTMKNKDYLQSPEMSEDEFERFKSEWEKTLSSGHPEYIPILRTMPNNVWSRLKLLVGKIMARVMSRFSGSH
jgi:hypothetical protein